MSVWHPLAEESDEPGAHACAMRPRGAHVCLLAGLLLAALATAAGAESRLMIIGDSVQSGTGLKRVTNQASYRLQRRGKIVVHNFSSPGAMMTDTVIQPGMHQAVLSVWMLNGYFKMNGLLVAVGGNDWSLNVDLATFEQAYASFLAGLPSKLPVACFGPTWRASEIQPNANGDTLDDFHEVIRQTCIGAAREYLDGLDAIPNDSAYFVDGIHPNDREHRKMAQFFERELGRLGWLP